MTLERISMGKILRADRVFWLGAVLPIFLLGAIYGKGIAYMIEKWVVDETYGHGFFVLPISLFLIWRRREAVRSAGGRGSLWGIVLVVASVALYFIGELATLYPLVHLSLWGTVVGLVVASIGPRGAKQIAFPLFYLLAMIPLPDFLYQGLSGRLQLISSALGIGCLQFVGVTAFREGNVIDLGPIQLQVVEACSGLRYLFPLAALALICAYLFRDRLWKRIFLFLSSFPIAIFLNGFRIGMTGVLVEYFGKGPAEGFFHDFSGWILFVASLGLLFAEMALLRRVGRRDAVSTGTAPEKNDIGREPVVTPENGSAGRQIAPTYLFSLSLLVPVLFASFQVGGRAEISPPRTFFADFPMEVAGWKGKTFAMEAAYRESLRFDDYLLADFHSTSGLPVNFYVAYYGSQRKGQSAHSPRTCIPGGGWEITSLQPVEINLSAEAAPPFTVNRAVIQKGDQKQLVFYWFQQRGRILSNEYMVKFYLFWDALTRNRTDGALVRLTAPVPPGESEESADRHLIEFAKSARPVLAAYIPE